MINKVNYENEEIDIIKNTLEKDDVVLESGAGIGFLSTFIALQNGSENVFAYEANENLFKGIEEVYKLNGVSPSLKKIGYF
jgi:tRNA G37 N-methylase Trm5